MNLKQISILARSLGINPARSKKADLIRIIQRTEGNFDCFAKAYDGECDQYHCCWRSDCLKSSVTKKH